jgi:epoxyqueuosine reductase
METATQKIKAKALQLGFAKVGIARAEELREEATHLHEWLQRGYHATMGWMKENAEKRTDPGLVVNGARSVISLAMNYFTPVQHSSEPGVGKISRYAWGDDYHDIVLEKLKGLWLWMQREFPDAQGRYYVDTGPVMDKVWAQRAGVGWIGKHTNVISQEMGSWIFLAELITTLELESDQPATDHCGTCTLCLDACPTNAIVEPYVVDSNRCISYLTIEHRGEIEDELKNQLEGWIYGCDICQDVCPWNHKFSAESDEQRFHPREWNIEPRLHEWNDLTQEEFTRKFKGSPIKRTKLDGLVRNVRGVLEGVKNAGGGPRPKSAPDASNSIDTKTKAEPHHDERKSP